MGNAKIALTTPWKISRLAVAVPAALMLLALAACGDSAAEPAGSPTAPPGMFSTLPTEEYPVLGDQPPTIQLNTPEPSPTPNPTYTPVPTHTPLPTPTPNPTGIPLPTVVPTPEPTATAEPTAAPTPAPTTAPMPVPTPDPTARQTTSSENGVQNTPSGGSRAICDAVESENPASVKILADAKVNVNVVCPGGNPPLYLAIKDLFSNRFHGGNGHANLQVVQTLLAAGADPSATDARGDPLLYVAIDREHSNRFHGRESYTVVLEALVAAGADVNAKTDDGDPILYEVINEEDSLRFHGSTPSTDTLRILIAAGANVNARSPRGVSPLQQAIKDELPDLVKILVEAGAR